VAKKKETLARRIFRLREAAGLTQLQVANAMGVRVTSYRNWERGRRIPMVTMALPLARALGVSAEVLLEGVS
jgi:transcriptional regulator with XRE-family HTH domain